MLAVASLIMTPNLQWVVNVIDAESKFKPFKVSGPQIKNF